MRYLRVGKYTHDFYPFLFIRELSCPSWIQAKLSLNCLMLTILGFPHNCLLVSCGDIGFKKNYSLVLAWKSGLKVPFLTLGCFCPLQTILLRWYGWVWQPPADSNGLLEHHYSQQRAVTPYPESLNSNETGAKLQFLSADGCHTWLEGQHCPLITYQGVFFKGGETLW